MTPKERDAMERTGMFLTVFRRTFDGDELRWAIIAAMLVLCFILMAQ